MSEKLTESITFKCKDDEKLKFEAIAKEKNMSLSKFVRAAVINYLAFSKDLANSGQSQAGLTTGISDILDILNIWTISEILKQIPLNELHIHLESLVIFLKEHHASNKSQDEYLPQFELVQQPRMLDITPRKPATKKAQPCDQLSLICHPTN